MSFWDRFRRRGTGSGGLASPWSDPDQLAAATWDHLLDLDADTAPISRALAMQVPAVARIRHTLTGTAGRLPLVIMNGAQPSTGRAGAWLARQPEPWRPRFQTMAWTVDALIFHGVAFWVVVERDSPGDGGRPRRFQLIPNGEVGFGDFGQPVSAHGHPVPLADWVVIDGPHEGILNFARRQIRAALDLESAATRAARNPVPSLELHQTSTTPLTDEQIAQLLKSWIAARAGKNGGVAYTSSSVEARTHGLAAEQLLIDGRNAGALNIARAMGVPAWLVDATVGGTSLQYSNTPARSRELIDYGLAPYLEAVCARLSMDDVLPAGIWCRFDTWELLRGDLKDRAEAAAAALAAQLYTPAELRAMEHGQPAEPTEPLPQIGPR